MTSAQIDHRFIRLLKSFSRYSSFIIITVGGLVLCGWAFNIPLLKSVLPNLATMKANTALAFILAGFGLWLSNSPDQHSKRPWATNLLAFAMMFLGLATLLEYVSGQDLHIDQLLFPDAQTPNASYPGRMSIATALEFVLAGISFILLNMETRHSHLVAQWIALLVGLLGTLALVGYLYNVESLYGVSAYASMAVHTASGFVFISLGILCARPESSLMSIVSSNTAGGITLRRVLPVAILMPIGLGWISLWGERADLYDSTFGTVLLALLMVILLGATIWLNASLLSHSDLSRQEAEERFRLVVEAAPVAMIMVDGRGKIQIANTHTLEMFGYQDRELLGKTVDILVPENFRSKHTGFRQGYFSKPESRAMGVGRDLFGVCKNGQEIPVEIGLSPVQTNKELFTLATIIDITERKKNEVEMKRSIEELARSNAELEQFAYVASHDLQEPLRMVSSYVQLLARRYQGKLDSDADEFIAFAVEGAGRMKVLINDLLTFSRVGTRGKELAPVALDEILERVTRTLGLMIEESNATITHDPLPQVLADDGQMLQLFQNLLANALKFRGESLPKIHIGVRRQKDRWLIYVRDNGIGIDSQFWDRIFVIFQRLHNREQYEGTGIGLAICRKIVERHGGHIWVESEPEKGSTFYFTLSPVEDDAAAILGQETAPETAKMSHRETIADRANDLI